MPLRPDRAAGEALRNVAAHRATTAVLALVTLAMTATTFLTAGRAAAAEAEVMASVDEAGPRLITVVVVDPHPGLDAPALARFEAITDVEWVLGLGEARDVRSDATGRWLNVAARDLLTPLPPLVTIDPGRTPRAGEMIIGPHPQARTQLLHPAGALVDGGVTRAIVGGFTSSGVIDDLDRIALVIPEDPATVRANHVYLLATRADAVAGIVEQVRALAGVDSPDALMITTAPELVDLGAVLSGQVGALSRQLALGAIGVGLLLVTLTMTLALSARRRDQGRRRALGASRSALIAQAVLEAAIPVTAGVILGAAGGLAAVQAWVGHQPAAPFIAATCVLITLTGTAAAIPPAALAALQDPLRILRVP